MIPGIRSATVLWIEAGGMSGPPSHRHQIEFPNDIVQFFDPTSRENEIILIGLPGGPLYFRPLTYRGTDYGQWTDIWRLGLLTPKMGGPTYSGRVIRIDKIRHGKEFIYELRVVSARSDEAKKLKEQSRYKSVTGGASGRRFGFR